MVEKQHGSFDLLQRLLNWTLVLKKPKCLWLSSFDLQNWGVQNVAGGTKVDFNCNPTE